MAGLYTVDDVLAYMDIPMPEDDLSGLTLRDIWKMMETMTTVMAVIAMAVKVRKEVMVVIVMAVTVGKEVMVVIVMAVTVGKVVMVTTMRMAME